MNGDDQNNPLASDFHPSWLQSGGISGESQVYESPFGQDDVDWATDAWTRDTPDVGEIRSGGGGCMSDAGTPPDSGTWVLGSVDGTCQWIDTTDCS